MIHIYYGVLDMQIEMIVNVYERWAHIVLDIWSVNDPYIYSFVLGMQDEHTLFSSLPPCCAIWSILVYVFQMNKCKLDYNARAMDCRYIWAMEHLRDEQIEEAQFQRDEEMEDQMEQLILPMPEQEEM